MPKLADVLLTFECKDMNRLLLLISVVWLGSGCESTSDCCGQPSTPRIATSLGITGSAEDVETTTQTGFLLMGGSTDVDAAFQWMIEASGGGDFVILRASGSTSYNEYIFSLGKVNSVETLLIDSRNKAELKETGDRIRQAEAVFIAGGNQSNYVNFWSQSEVSAALKYLIDVKKVPIGGTSAGCAVLSEFIFDAKNGSVTSVEALADPYTNLVSLSRSFIQIPLLQNILADQHYAQREREGRHVAFLARLQKDFGVATPKGIGVDEKTALCILSNGDMRVFGVNYVHFLQSAGSPEVCEPGQKLSWSNNQQAIQVNSIRGSVTGTPAFNMASWPTTTDGYWSVVNGVLNK
jgi:cyanophycinase